MITLSRSKTRIRANPEKVLARYFKYSGEERIRPIVSAVSSMENRAVEEIQHSVLENFGNIEAYTKDLSTLTSSRKLLLGSYFTTFHIRVLTGKAIAGKGMALFPERDWELLQLGNLIIPYAMSDSAIGFARVDLQEVIDELVKI